VLAVARGFERDEARETLLHEAMHGLFYTCAPFEAACWSFWRTSLSEAQRELWRTFLGGLGYDGANEELAVNEFQVSYRVSYHRTRKQGTELLWGHENRGSPLGRWMFRPRYSITASPNHQASRPVPCEGGDARLQKPPLEGWAG
jgi:hypothetical protein